MNISVLRTSYMYVQRERTACALQAHGTWSTASYAARGRGKQREAVLTYLLKWQHQGRKHGDLASVHFLPLLLKLYLTKHPTPLNTLSKSHFLGCFYSLRFLSALWDHMCVFQANSWDTEVKSVPSYYSTVGVQVCPSPWHPFHSYPCSKPVHWIVLV